jgi:hypothetical protein
MAGSQEREIFVPNEVVKVLQPGPAQFHLSMAGAWTTTTLQLLPSARSAQSILVPETFQAFGDAMATLLAFYLALSHAREVTHRAPWLASPLAIAPREFEDLYITAERFRDALMHLGDKAERPLDTVPPVPAKPDDWRRSPRVAISLSIGFEGGEASFYAPLDKSTTWRGWTRLSWDAIEQTSQTITTWTLDLLARWPELQRSWAEYVEAHGERMGARP